MFSLIITIISIALVAVLAIATIYYLGGTVTDQSDRAAASTIVNQGQQIKGALEVYFVQQGGYPTGTSEQAGQALVNLGYLNAMPTGVATWNLETGNVFATGVNQSQCEAVNANYGITGIPACTDANLPDAVCCSE